MKENTITRMLLLVALTIDDAVAAACAGNAEILLAAANQGALRAVGRLCIRNKINFS